jgi:hypothetical protein
MTELSARKLLTAYRLSRRLHGMDAWYGVTAHSLADARALLGAYGYEVYPTDPAVTVRERPIFTEHEQRHLGPNMGPCSCVASGTRSTTSAMARPRPIAITTQSPNVRSNCRALGASCFLPASGIMQSVSWCPLSRALAVQRD